MKSLTEHLWFEVPNRRGFVNITRHRRGAGPEERRPGGALPGQRHAHHGSVFINDAESGLLHDYEVWLEKLAPHEPVTSRTTTTAPARTTPTRI